MCSSSSVLSLKRYWIRSPGGVRRHAGNAEPLPDRGVDLGAPESGVRADDLRRRRVHDIHELRRGGCGPAAGDVIRDDS